MYRCDPIHSGEPLIESPVAFEWGADGKLWVAEMRDYPSGEFIEGSMKNGHLEAGSASLPSGKGVESGHNGVSPF